MTSCKYCKTELKDDTLKCYVCGEIQSYKKYPKIKIFFTIMKTMSILFFIPLLVWLATNFYIDKKQELEFKENSKNEILSSISGLETKFELLYRPCFGINAEVCIKNAEIANRDFMQKIYELKSKIISYYPELFPTVKLLESTNFFIRSETFNLWADYNYCFNKKSNWKYCMAEKDRRPIVNVQIAKFIIEYLSAKVQKIVNNQTDNKYINDIIRIREDICLNLPRKEIEKYNGWRTVNIDTSGNKYLNFLDFRKITNIIWIEYLVPGSGLNVDKGYKSIKVIDKNSEICKIIKETYNYDVCFK